MSPPARKAPRQRGYSAISKNGQRNGTRGEAQTSNGGTPQDNEQSIFKIERYGKGQAFTSILNETLRNKRLCREAHPLVALAYALSKGGTWQLRSSQLRKEFGWGEQATRTVMHRLADEGFALLLKGGGGYGKACGQRWLLRESPSIPWPAKFETRATPVSKTFETRTIRASTYPRPTERKTLSNKRRVTRGAGEPRVGQRLDVQRKLKGCHRASRSGSGCGSFGAPKVPYPASEDEMYETLDALDILTDPDHDGDFFAQMEASNWTIRGDRVWDWPAVYQARLLVTSPG